jgi:PPOX class probable F420-dependent enzyme
MAIHIPDELLDLLAPQKKALGFLAFVRKDGSPQVNPIWFDWDGKHIIINTARGRVKDRVLRKHPRVALAVADPEAPERYLELRGRVVEETEEGGYDMIRHLNEKYKGNYEFPKRPGEVRVTYKILPDRISAQS